MSKKLRQVAVDIAVISVIAIPLLVGAQVIEQSPVAPVTTVTGVIGVLNFILRILYTIFFIVAAIFLIIAGFTYLTAAGDPEKVGKAKNQLIYAIVAIVIALLAVGIRGIVTTVLKPAG